MRGGLGDVVRACVLTMAYTYYGLYLLWPILTMAYTYYGLYLLWPILTMACVQLCEEQVGDEQVEEDGKRQHVDHDGAHHAIVGVGWRHEDAQQVVTVDVVGEEHHEMHDEVEHLVIGLGRGLG